MRESPSWAPPEAFSRHLLTSGHSPSTVRTSLAILRLFGQWCLEREVSPAEAPREAIERYLGDSLGRVSRNTVALRLSVLRSFFAFLDGDDRRTHGLRVKAEKLAPRLPFAREELDRLLGACRNDRDRAMVLVAARLGLRVSEVVAIRAEDVRLDVGLLLVRGKGSKQRWLPLDAELVAMLSPFVRSGAIWRMKSGRAMSTKRAQRNMEEIARRAGVRAHWHRLRTTFANQMIEAGIPIETLRVLMGHESSSTTERYAAFTVQKTALDRLRRVWAAL
jgi:site-specific recombinase XerD